MDQKRGRNATAKVTVSSGRPAALGLSDQIMVGAVGLKIARGTDYETWEQAGARIMRAVNSFAWCLGDWVLFGQTRYPDRYRRAIEFAQLDYQTVRNYAWVARKFEMSRRRDTLSFQHHAEVASLSPADQDIWLDRAEYEGWSRNELRKRVRTVRAEAGVVPHADLLPRVRATKTRVTRWRNAAEQAGMMLEDWITDTLDNAAGMTLERVRVFGPLPFR